MKMTFQPKKKQRSREHGFRKRMLTANGRKVLASRRKKGRREAKIWVDKYQHIHLIGYAGIYYKENYQIFSQTYVLKIFVEYD